MIKDKFFKQKKLNLKVEVEEIKNMEENAMVIAQSVAEQLEKRIPFRRVLKTTIERMMENKRIKGIKIEIAGRLGFIKNIKCAYCGENNDFKEEALALGHIGLPYTFEFGGEFICRCMQREK